MQARVAFILTIFLLLTSLVMSKQEQQKIAVIGGGASGIACAYLLKKNGYKRVTIFEADRSVGGAIKSIKVDKKTYDKAAMFVPGSTLSGPGIEPVLAEMIKVSGEDLIPALDFQAYEYNEQNASVQLLPDLLRKYSQDELKDQLIKGLEHHTKYLQCLQGGLSCGECSLCDASNPNENFHEWGARLGVSAYSDLVVYVVDGLGGGPLSFAPARQTLHVTSFWIPAEVIRVLSSFGFTAGDLPEGTLPNVVALFQDPSQRWWFLQRGFQKFLSRVVQKKRIRVRLRTRVLELRFVKAQQKWRILTNRGRMFFDKVIVTTPTSATLPFLFEGAQKELIASAVPSAPPNDVFVVRTSRTWGSDCGKPQAIWPDGFGLGSPSLIDPSVGGVVKPTFWQQRYDQCVSVVGTYTLNKEITPEKALDACKRFASNVLSFEITKVLAHDRYFYPSSPQNVTAWLQGWASLQGENGLYFFGEAFAGSGVPAITSSASRFIAQHFAKAK